MENSENLLHACESRGINTSDVREEKCPVVDEKLNTPIFEASFIETGNKILKYKCPVCFKKFKNVDKVQKHVNSHVFVYSTYTDGNLKCSECNIYCESINILRQHRESHKKIKGRPRKDGNASENNVKSDENEKTFICDKCAKRFKTKQNLLNHYLVHIDIRPFECGQCHKRFKLKQQLQNHLKVHEDVRPFTCEVCKKSFKFKQQLENHSKTHIDVRPFKCSFCDKAFKLKQQLQIHNKVHDDTRPFKCEICSKAFKLKQQLQFHEKVHSDNRPFSCEACGKSFKFKQQLRIHYKTHATEFIENKLLEPSICLTTDIE